MLNSGAPRRPDIWGGGQIQNLPSGKFYRPLNPYYFLPLPSKISPRISLAMRSNSNFLKVFSLIKKSNTLTNMLDLKGIVTLITFHNNEL